MNKEIAFQREAVKEIKKRRIMVWNINSVTMSNFPDLMLFSKGRMILIELKDNKSAEFRQGQIKTLIKIYEEGGWSAMIYDMDSLKEFLDDFQMYNNSGLQEKIRYKWLSKTVLPYVKEEEY